MFSRKTGSESLGCISDSAIYCCSRPPFPCLVLDVWMSIEGNYSEDMCCDRSLLPSLYDLDLNIANQLFCQLKLVLLLHVDPVIQLFILLLFEGGGGTYFLIFKVPSNKALVKILLNLCISRRSMSEFIYQSIDHSFLSTVFIQKLLGEKASPF